MRQLIPQFIIQQMAAGRAFGSFPAASLFIDISGFSRITESLMEHGQYGAEILAGLIKKVFAPLVESIYAQNGFVSTIYGDALLVFFIEKAGEPPAVQRALAAAWAGQARLAGITEQTTPYGTFSMSTKVGMATGNVEWSVVRALDEKRVAYYFRGAAVDGSAAAEKKATSGEIVLVPDAYAQVKSLVGADVVDGYFRVNEIYGNLPPDRPVNLPAIDSNLAAHFSPPALLAQSLEGEFRQVVAMFVGLPAGRTPEQMTFFIRQIFSLQDRYGGLFNHVNFGDKGAHLLLIWGAPVAHENDIERALNLILELQLQSDMPIKAGITYSIVYAGFIGSAFRQDYTTYGRGVNLASRFMSAASRGEIWVDEDIAGRAEKLFEFDDEGEQPFKGFSAPQKVFSLVERKEAEYEFQIQEMVGRDEELSRLAGFVRPILNQQFAGVMLISGEAGMGKSILVQHLQAAEMGTGADIRWAFCQTDEILRESLNPFAYWLKRYFGQAEKQSPARNKRNFNRHLDHLIMRTQDARLVHELDRLRSCLGALLDLYWSDSLYAHLDARGRYENTMQSLIVLIQAECRQQPLVLLIEDTQWLDEDSPELLTRLVHALKIEQQAPYPLAIIATARPEADFLPAGPVTYEQIKLDELSRETMSALVHERLDGPPAADLLNLLDDHAQGNPFFAVQILLFLQDRKLLVPGEAGWTLSATEETVLPPDVRALLVARLDTLEIQVKEAVQTASILGREFELAILTRMLADESLPALGNRISHTLVNLVDSAEQAAIWRALTQMRYIFRHALLRDVAYSMQLQSRLQALHALAVTALEAICQGKENIPFAELGYHAERAGMTDEARRYLKLAGDKATDAYQNGLALQYYSRALRLIPAGADDDRFEILMARAKVYHLTGEREAQQENLARLQDTADRLGDRFMAQAKLEMARMAGVTGNFDQAVAAISAAVELAQATDFVSELARGYLLWGWYLYRQSNLTGARTHYDRAISFAHAAEMLDEEANSLNGLAILAMDEGDFAGAHAYFEQARERYRQAGRLTGEGNILNNLSVLASRQSQFAAAKRYSEEALALRRQIGDRKGEGNTANNLGEMCRALGQFADAEHYYQLSLEIRREVGDRRGEGLVLLSMATLATDFGDYTRAEQLQAQALVIIREIEDKMLEGMALMNQGSAQVARGRVNTGLRLCAEAVAILREIDHRLYLAQALYRLGSALYQSGQLPEARAAYRETADLGQQLDPTLLAQAEAGMADVALAEGKGDEALLHVENVLAYLQSKPIVELEEPFPLALSCYRVLADHDDPRATEILQSVYRLLQERAERIENPEKVKAYLGNVPTHAQIVSAYAVLFG